LPLLQLQTKIMLNVLNATISAINETNHCLRILELHLLSPKTKTMLNVKRAKKKKPRRLPHLKLIQDLLLQSRVILNMWIPSFARTVWTVTLKEDHHQHKIQDLQQQQRWIVKRELPGASAILIIGALRLFRLIQDLPKP